MARKDEDAAIKAAQALLAAGEEEETEETEATAETQETPEGEASQGAEEEIEITAPWEVELPEDLVEELSTPTDEEILAEVEEPEEWDTMSDEEKRLYARARAAEKKLEHAERLRVQADKKNWIKEAEKFFPLAYEVDKIEATSRRGFLREAQARHEQVKPFVKKITDEAAAEAKRVAEEEKAKARAEAEAAWGKTPKGTATPTEAAITVEQLQRNREKGDLASTIRAMIFPNKE